MTDVTNGGILKPATSIEALDIHLGYLRNDVTKILGKVDELDHNMATKSDIERIESKMLAFATVEQFKELEQRVENESARSSFERWITTVTKLAAFIASIGAIGGMIYVFVHFIDRVPKAMP